MTVWAAASSLLSFPGRYAGPYLAERLGGIRIYAAATVLSAAAVLVMIGAGTWRMPTHFVAFGLTFGAMLPIRAVVMSHWFSGPGYGRVMGAQWSLAADRGARSCRRWPECCATGPGTTRPPWWGSPSCSCWPRPQHSSATGGRTRWLRPVREPVTG